MLRDVTGIDQPPPDNGPTESSRPPSTFGIFENDSNLGILPHRLNRAEPTRLFALLFHAKAAILRGVRSISNLSSPLRRFSQGQQSQYPVLLAESRTVLWTADDVVEQSLQLGKVQNLRKACARLHLVEIPAGETFSFWKQIGRATKARGYTMGRELRQGCLVPTVGGGLCQLSNALHDVALKTGGRIVERHAHTAIVPGSAAEQGRDATIFWNYVDLRFAALQDILIIARLSADEMVLQFWGKHGQSQIEERIQPFQSRPSFPSLPVNSCSDCGLETCFRHAPRPQVKSGTGKAFLIEECWPEFDEFSRQVRSQKDELFIPWHSTWSRQPQRYRWTAGVYSKVVAANFATLSSSLQGKFRTAESLPPIAGQVRRSQRLAGYYSQRLSSSTSFLYVAQTLLPFLWRAGDLGGRRFAVLLTRTPLRLLHSRLDQLSRQFPEQKTFAEFRAPDWMVEAEAAALDQAEALVTPHAWLAGLFPQKTQKLSWRMPQATRNIHGNHVVFPGPTVSRKGAYQLRDAMKGRGEKVLLLGNNLECESFWDGIDTCNLQNGQDWLQQARAVVQPAFFENAPRPLLRALAAGVPVIATPECGLDAHPGLALVGAGDADGLRRALKEVLSSNRKLRAQPQALPPSDTLL